MRKCSVCTNKVGFLKHETQDEHLLCEECYKELKLRDEDFLEHKVIEELLFKDVLYTLENNERNIEHYNNYYKKKIKYRIGSLMLSILLLIVMLIVSPILNGKPTEISIYVLIILLILVSIELIIIRYYYKKLLKEE